MAFASFVLRAKSLLRAALPVRSDFSLDYLAARACPAAIVSVAIGIIAGMARLAIAGGSDFSWHLRAARQLIAGADIYNDSIAYDPYHHVPYPLPAAFLALPFVWLRDNLAAATFFGASTALIAWCLLRAGDAWRLSIFLSWPFLFALVHAQSSPLLLCLYLVPSALPLVLVKPNIAIPMALTRFPSKDGLALTLAIGLVSLSLSVLAFDLVYSTGWLSRCVANFGPSIRPSHRLGVAALAKSRSVAVDSDGCHAPTHGL